MPKEDYVCIIATLMFICGSVRCDVFFAARATVKAGTPKMHTHMHIYSPLQCKVLQEQIYKQT